ncbi:MAG: acyl-CoA synthetase (AMP-forming)/AMP-acid ligase [Mycobacterium sp.]|jgi:acyl-CoA synthetase (AMP-forming)/AMP-acid ligase II|nr:acyl-CoA synthetase (AMP-forming)/AMP-acid ligase [Mycobacterium sp.]
MTTIETLSAGAGRAQAETSLWRLGHMLDGASETAPNSTALIVGAQRRRINYAELAELVVARCQVLQRSGLRPGDVVALQSTNSVEFVVGLLAAARAGAVVAPLDPALPTAQRRTRVEMAGARVTLIDGRRCDGASPSAVNKPIPGLTGRDALIMFTSGTTGKPKMVPWTHDNIAAGVAGVIGAYQLGPTDATVAVMPLFHGHGLIAALLATLASGGRVLLPARGRFSANTFWDDVEIVDATWYTAVPTIHQILLERSGAELPRGYRGRLRFIRSCSASLSPTTVQRMEATFGAPVLAAYGMTEATHQVSTVLPFDNEGTRLNTVGASSSVSVRIVDDDGATRPIGAIGEIWLSGPTVVRGYLNDSGATASNFVDGWLHTGDLGAVDRHGALSVTGRIKEQINRGGEKISPERVENVLKSHPDVAQAVVFGVPDPLYGERVAAVVVTRDRCHVDLIAHSRGRLADFEIPERIAFTDELPLTSKGSVNRRRVAEQFGGKPAFQGACIGGAMSDTPRISVPASAG